MSLGPFELDWGKRTQPARVFESLPFDELDQEIPPSGCSGLRRIFRTTRTCSPGSAGVRAAGRRAWPTAIAVDRASKLVHELIASGQVSGFKDPRVPLVWPFWQEVLRRVDGVRVVPVVVTRSPHEVAMSIFQRSRGRCDYDAALDITAVHFHSILAILNGWPGGHGIVRFNTEVFTGDLRSPPHVCAAFPGARKRSASL